MSSYLLAFDLGTGGCKAALVATDGTIVASAVATYPTTYPEPGHHEQRPTDWWDAVVASSRELLTQVPSAPGSIVAIGLSGQSLALVPLDAHGELLVDSVPIWSDARGADAADRTFEQIAEDEWYLRTGGGFPAGLYTAFKVGWLAAHRPEVMARTAVVVGSKDVINHRLTGAVATDRSYASGSGVYDLSTRAYAPDLIEAVGIPADLLPEVVEPTTVIGGLSQEAASALGLVPGTPVVAGGVDNACMALGAGLRSTGRAYCALGSSNWITVSDRLPVLDVVSRPFVFDHVVPDLYISALSTFGGGSSLSWLVDVLGATADIDELMAEAADRPVGANGLVCVPTLAGGTVLEGGSEVRGAFAGLDLAHTRGDLVRAVVEGIAASLARAARVLGDHVDLPAEIVAVGGGSRGPLQLQVLASALGRTVVRTPVEQDCAALGAAALAAVGAGVWSSLDDLPETAPVEQVPPDADAADRYRQLAEVFEAVAADAGLRADLLGTVRRWAHDPDGRPAP